ncbi:DsrE family protein [Candidatus Woesearchaeota archaeon]|nr:DsrE family protein [Candidatus Woesearchaeota archaeon]
MKIGIVLSAADPEIVWNALRFGNTGLQSQHTVKIFLINKGKILACGTCLKSRQKEGSNICPLSTMKDLLRLVEESDKVLTFG